VCCAAPLGARACAPAAAMVSRIKFDGMRLKGLRVEAIRLVAASACQPAVGSPGPRFIGRGTYRAGCRAMSQG